MSHEPIQLSREQLYEQVWSEPVRTLAPRYGLSDVGLAKICKRLKVPVPGRGHWVKLAAGKPVRKRPLPVVPPSSPPVMHEVSINREPRREIVDTGPFQSRPPSKAFPRTALQCLTRYVLLDPLVRQTAEALKQSNGR